MSYIQYISNYHLFHQSVENKLKKTEGICHLVTLFGIAALHCQITDCHSLEFCCCQCKSDFSSKFKVNLLLLQSVVPSGFFNHLGLLTFRSTSDYNSGGGDASSFLILTFDSYPVRNFISIDFWRTPSLLPSEAERIIYNSSKTRGHGKYQWGVSQCLQSQTLPLTG